MATEGLDWHNPKSWQVLVVDDEPDNLEVITIFLRFYGAVVKTARNGIEGLAQLDTFSPNLILLDLSMPQMDGWEMLAKLRARPDTRQTHIVALTAHAMPRDRDRAREGGFNGYVSKPINMPTLLSDLSESSFPVNEPPLTLPVERIPEPPKTITVPVPQTATEAPKTGSPAVEQSTPAAPTVERMPEPPKTVPIPTPQGMAAEGFKLEAPAVEQATPAAPIPETSTGAPTIAAGPATPQESSAPGATPSATATDRSSGAEAARPSPPTRPSGSKSDAF